MNRLSLQLRSFFYPIASEGAPLLIALSGGVDSLALFELLRHIDGIEIAVAHVDHGWREESSKEAMLLKEYVEGLSIPFHLLELDPAALSGNLEEASRLARYRFFSALCKEHGYCGVATGHQAEDQVETVLKRLFEGASTEKLSGMASVATIFGVKVYRPLLDVTKKELEQLLHGTPFSPFHDPTNEEERFLRARMRRTLLPTLEAQFGKNIGGNLLRFAKEMAEVGRYLERRGAPLLQRVVDGPFGCYIDFTKEEELSSIEVDTFIRRLLSSRGVHISREQHSELSEHLLLGKANKRVEAKVATLFVDRKSLFVIDSTERNKNLARKPLILGEMRWGEWHVTVSEGVRKAKSDGWREAWQGAMHVALPKGAYSIRYASSNSPHVSGTTLSKWLSRHKAPTFLKELFPVIWQGERVYHEFLSGREESSSLEKSLFITLKYCKE